MRTDPRPTARLTLRRWRPEDRAPFAALNADPEVMRYFPAPMTPTDSDALVDRIEEGFAAHGFGMWAVEVRGGAAFIGFVGLTVPRFEASFSPCVEVGWRLAREHWGRGYAPEAALAALEFGFREAGLAEILSFTATTNRPSRRVMEKIGMVHDPAEDFDHPNVPPGHPLRPHVLYRVRAEAAGWTMPWTPSG